MKQQEKVTELSALQRAALLVEKLQARLDAAERARTEPVAVIGMGCRFPGGAVDGPSYWRLLSEGVDAVREIPASRWNVAAYYDPQRGAPGKMYGLRGGFLDDVERFDAGFFGISPREAASMDPQQRLVLEVTWEALENAGQAPDRLAGTRTGVFMGVMSGDYLGRIMKLNDPAWFDGYSATGNGFCFVPGRVSYVLGLRGPSVPVDTACSSSLVALHLACQSLRAGESTMALAGGVSLILSPETTICLCSMQALASDGRCKAFDASADGYVRGEGCGVLVLKRLCDAQRDGDAILALIRGSAVNHDGASGGLTVPSGPAQQAVIQQALESAGVDPSLVSYIEAHGTGTPLGDPIELRALGAALRKPAQPTSSRPFFIGSAKTNIGHLEPAAGIAGVIKTILALNHREIPPHLHFQTANPHIEWDRIPAVVPTQRTPWPAVEGRRIAGVSGFGLSGTNAHVVLEEAPPPKAPAAPAESGRPELVVLSAKSPEALVALASAHRSFLRQSDAAAAPLGAISYTAALGRVHLDHRLAMAARSREELAEQLDAFLDGESRPGLSAGVRAAGAPRRVAFVLPGQGSQWKGMGRRLYEGTPVFRDAIDRCQAAMRPHIDWSVAEVLTRPEEQPRWGDIDVVQPMLFAVQVALAALWRSLGVEPHAVVGHSMGEIAAAHIAGALELDDAARIICKRSQLLRRVSGKGAMAVVDLSREQVRAEIRGLEDRISIAVSNSPTSTVLSGDPAALKELLSRLEGRGVFCRWVKVDVASHSPQMDPLRDELLRRMDGVRPRAGSLPLYSTVTGAVVHGGELDARYWARNLRDPVLFTDAVSRLIQDGHALFIELSPHPILLPFVEATLNEAALKESRWRGLVVPSLHRDQEDWAVLLSSLGALYTRGHEVDFHRLLPDRRRWVPLPTYPWQRERHWVDAAPAAPDRARAARAVEGARAHPLLGAPFTTAVQPGARFWEATLGPDAPPYLADHRVGGAVVLPAAAYLEMALSAAREALGEGAHEIVDASFKEALLLHGGRARTVQLALTEGAAFGASFQVSSLIERAAASPPLWVSHAAGRIQAVPAEQPQAGGDGPIEPIAALLSRCSAAVSGEAHYAALAGHGISYGPAFQGVQQIFRGDAEAVGRVRLPEALAAQAAAYEVHPALLDACFQVLAAAVPDDVEPGAGPAVPVALARLRVLARPGTEVWCHARLRARGGERDAAGEFDVLLLDDAGRVLVEALGLRVQRLERAAVARDMFFALEWRHAPAPEAPPPEAPGPEGRWLLLGDTAGLADAIAPLLRERGDEVFRVEVGGAGRAARPGVLHVDPASPDAFDRALAEAAGDGAPLRGVIHLFALDSASGEALTPEALDRAAVLGCASALHLAQALARRASPSAPRLWLVTRGVHGGAVHGAAAPGAVPDVAQAPLWGLGRALAVELPELRCTRVDVSPDLSLSSAAATLARELLAGDAEEEIALAPDGRYVARIARRSPVDAGGEALVPADGRPFRVELDGEGRARLRPAERRSPGPREVEIEVEAADPGWSDDETWRGAPGRPGGSKRLPPLGGLSGRVVARGDDVRGVELGQAVIALGPAAPGSHATVPIEHIAARPRSLRAEQAAAIPRTILRAWYALRGLGRLRRGERVLIAGAPSGVVRAAALIARRAGAEVLAAAATPQQGDALRALGIERVLSAGDASFVERLVSETGGSGVDLVVIAPLAADVDRLLPGLSEDGRLVHLRAPPLDAAPPVVDVNVACAVVDLPGLARRRPHRLEALWREVLDAIDAGELPPPEVEVVPASRASAALGGPGREVVLALDDPGARLAVPPAGARRLRGDGTYLITGGLGGLGLSVAAWMVDQGARHLALVTRSAAMSPAQEEAVAALEAAGARVIVAAADVADRSELAGALADIAARLPPLRGVVHAAGVLDDGVVLHQSLERLRRVMAPKVLGGWNLHALTREAPLDFFVLYSSAASLFGAAGQSNYAAANAFLDALAHHRRALGLPGTSINWGAFSEVGLAAAQANRGARLAERGSGSLTPAEGNAILGQLLDGEAVQVAVMPLDLQRWMELLPGARSSPWLSELIEAPAAEANGGGTSALLEALRAAGPAEGRAQIERFIREQMGHVLRLDPARIDPDAPLQGFGFDSLMAMELRNRLGAALRLSLPASLFWKHPTLSALGEHLASLFSQEREPETGTGPGPASSRPEVIPLSTGQERLWFLDRVSPGTPLYNVHLGLRLRGTLDQDALRRSLEEIVRRHEVLRTRFPAEGGEPRQVIAPPDAPVALSVVTLRGLPEAARDEAIAQRSSAEGRRPFDLEAGPLFRAELLVLDDDDFALLLTQHHIVTDGWSIGVFMQELAALYRALSEGCGSPLPPVSRQQAEIAQQERAWLASDAAARERAYWQERLRGLPPLQLPVDRVGAAARSPRGATVSFALPPALHGALRALAERERCSLFVLLFAAFSALLHRTSGQEDFGVGTVVANREGAPPDSIGFFANTLVLRCDLSGDPSFTAWLRRAREIVLEAIDHQALPFSEVVQATSAPRHNGASPLVRACITLENLPMHAAEVPGMTWSLLRGAPDGSVEGTAKFDLAMILAPAEEGLGGILEYSTELFDPATAARTARQFQVLLEAIAAAPSARVSRLPLLDAEERRRLLIAWNDAALDFPRDACIHDLVASQAARTPDAVAVIAGRRAVTYAELDRRANQLAHRLRRLGVGRDVRVGVCMSRTEQMVIALLGILKAGGAYVPLDPAYPRERLSFLLADAEVPVLLTEQRLAGELPDHKARILSIDAPSAEIEAESAAAPPRAASPGDLAYVIYTSGSTGRPKGVMIEHRNAVAFLTWAMAAFPASDLGGVLAATSICFDLSVFEIFAPLCCGGRVILAQNALALSDLPAAREVTLINTVPSAMSALLGVGGVPPSVRTVNLAGEALPGALVDEIYRLGHVERVFNLYGPSETTTYSTWAAVGRERARHAPTIGRPIANTTVLVLDPRRELVPVGVPGEVYIGGAGVARGYLGRPELTAERFVPSPFGPDPDARLYRTGDLARWLPEGELEYLGRMDHQVKLRGFRIELDEIGAVLSQHPGVSEAVAVVREDAASDRHLVAYVALRGAGGPGASELRSYLSSKLPEYMVPSAIMVLGALPRTANGKVDRKVLPVPEAGGADAAEAYVAPRTREEEVLAAIWRELLGVDRVGAHDNFFELGGHSLQLSRVLIRARAAFRPDLPMRVLIEAPTLAGAARAIQAACWADPEANGSAPDLEADAALDPMIAPARVAAPRAGEPRAVLLTGATGFLGAFLLDELRRRTQATVYCLVRCRDTDDGLRRLRQSLESYALMSGALSPRVVPVPGDISRPLLGLGAAEFERLAAEVDAIYHNGALVNFAYPYEALKAPNVLGTQEVLRLAAASRAKPLHYISTISVLPAGRAEHIREDEPLGPPASIAGGYAQSKWVAEKLVRAASLRGLPVTIYRPGTVSGDSRTGAWNTGELMCRTLKACVQLGSYPDMDALMDLAPVDYVSSAVVALSMRPESVGRTYHLVNPEPVRAGAVWSLLRSRGYRLRSCGFEEWLDGLAAAASTSQDSSLAELLAIMELLPPEDRTAAGPRAVRCDCRGTLEMLEATTVACPRIDEGLLSTYISPLITSGFLDPPGAAAAE
ncbi:amino acid adenylation domain-containing protein [Sorangium sp. So ce1078]|uniref:amino acid adenylation domain-containing protein n=1 Tax=Sorangium sp. So ce1078 TaxID=3133329 RepID=UPI003F60B999